MALSCIISEIKQYIGLQFFISHLDSTTSLGGSPSEYYHNVWHRKHWCYQGRVQRLTLHLSVQCHAYNRPHHWDCLMLDKSAIGQLSSLSSRTKWQRLPVSQNKGIKYPPPKKSIRGGWTIASRKYPGGQSCAK